MLVEDFGGGLPAERFARPAGERGGDGGEVLDAVTADIQRAGRFGRPAGLLSSRSALSTRAEFLYVVERGGCVAGG
jgi:hypothetical protein